jgi:hypothetical protein
MSHRVLKNPNDRDNLACLICITAYAGYFLQEIVLLGQSIETGFEGELGVQAQEHFATTRAAISRILTEAEANLDNLQALCFGVSGYPALFFESNTHNALEGYDFTRVRRFRCRLAAYRGWVQDVYCA